MCDNPDYLTRTDLAILVRRVATEGKGGYPNADMIRLAKALEGAEDLDHVGFDPEPYVEEKRWEGRTPRRSADNPFGDLKFNPRMGYIQRKYSYDERTE